MSGPRWVDHESTDLAGADYLSRQDPFDQPDVERPDPSELHDDDWQPSPPRAKPKDGTDER